MVLVHSKPPIALPLLGERAGVRADVSSHISSHFKLNNSAHFVVHSLITL
jgi:hypothetical protein